MLDIAPWNHLLQRYVDAQGRVDYRRWQQTDAATLEQWLARSAEPDADERPADQLAGWINLYNALTIAQILRLYPIASVQQPLWGMPNWLAFVQFFKRPVFWRGGTGYSLDRIEHGIIRPQFRDPRIHFALVCGAIGCPLLRPAAYGGPSIEAQLEADAVRFMHNPAKVRYDAATQTLYCSKIFKWYGQDFRTVAPTLPAYIGQYLPTVSPAAAIAYLPYDWGLNGV